MGKSRNGTNDGRSGRPVRWAFSLSLIVIAALAVLLYLAMGRDKGFPPGLRPDGPDRTARDEIDAGLLRSFRGLGIEDGTISFSTMAADTAGPSISVVRIVIPPAGSLLQVYNAIIGAIASTGYSVTAFREPVIGSSIEVEIGARDTVTHMIFAKRSVPEPEPPEAVSEGPTIAIVVDDFGYSNGDLVRKFLALDARFTIAVLPGLRHSKDICGMAEAAGREVILHLPMEPKMEVGDEGRIPMVRVSLLGSEIEDAVEKALRETPGAVGMNNHMGSRATEDRRVMDAVLVVCKKHGLFFFDSLTTSSSVIREAAMAAGVPSGTSDLCLDTDPASIRRKMRTLLSLALRRGKAAAIIHAREKSLEELTWFIGEAQSAGVRFVNLSEFVNGTDAAMRPTASTAI